MALAVEDLSRSIGFWTAIGMREVGRDDHVAVLEMRGGTHLVLFPGRPAAAADGPFDLMVEDLDATHSAWQVQGLTVEPIVRGEIHDTFVVVDPDGYRIQVNDTHVVGPV